MKFNFVAAFRLDGISAPADDIELYSTEHDSRTMTLLLTSDPNRHCFCCDRGMAIANVMLRALFGPPLEQGWEPEVVKAIEKIQQGRTRDAGSSAFLIVEGAGLISPSAGQISPVKQLDEFSVCIDGIQKSDIKQQFAGGISGGLAALGFATNGDFAAHKTAECVYLIDPAGKPLYSLTFSGSASPFVSKPLSDDARRFVAKFGPVLAKEATVSRLFTQSVDRSSDPLKAFMSAWMALEAFINKMFKDYYEKAFLSRVTAPVQSALTMHYFSRVSDVMKDKYRLSDKFAVVSFILGGGEADLKEFESLKKSRDNLTHGGEINDASLPTVCTQALLRRYMRLHLEWVVSEKTA